VRTLWTYSTRSSGVWLGAASLLNVHSTVPTLLHATPTTQRMVTVGNIGASLKRHVRCLLDLGTRISRTRALVAVGFGSVAGGFLIDLDHPLQAWLQGKSVFNLQNWLIPHGRFLHIPILILAFFLLEFSVALLLGRLLAQSRTLHLRGN
jgi:hypothetical protein